MRLHQVYPPKEQAGARTVIDIVAVHGLNPGNEKDHAFQTWTKNGRNWLTDDLPEDVPGARIFIYEYNSYAGHSGQTQRLVEEGRHLLNVIRAHRADQPGRPLVFIAHDLGGLLVKQCLVNAKLGAKFATLFNAVKGLVFFGVPHRGSNEKWLVMAKGATSVLSLFFSKNESDFLEAMTRGSPSSDTLTELFRGISSHCPIVSFYESKPTGKFGIIVDKRSATIGVPDEYITALEASHSDMCRFDTAKDEDNQSYLLVKKRVKTLVNNALSTPVESRDDGSFRDIPFASTIYGFNNFGDASS